MLKFICAAGALMMTTGSIAQPNPPEADQSVPVEDLRKRHAQRFDTLDADRNGQLSPQEMRAGRRGPGMGGMRGPRGRFGMRPGGPDGGGPGAMFRGADANSDGIVTREEFSAQSLTRFRQLDVNGDGRIAADEVRGGRGPIGRGAGMGAMRQGRFAMLDADRSGGVSRAEFDRLFSQRLERLDSNRDGKVTREERRALRRGRPGRV